ncbi:LANO_0D01046g1_1 [Lachancea nothofagi CBS 11611]|uniref:LANO_0D01046g1_1 n=1 Tax=Lachancea nothofagi CBS 11611 TaxID=1266666 RepID=A0A1G4JDG6_9SACH|nr:LANO_0D01046g1_1 [Lachancea nothofagi CBS 11611]
MSKRAREDTNRDSRKKYKFSTGIVEPCVSGIYATCARKHEKQAAQELESFFQEKLEEYYGDELNEDNNTSGDDDDISVEDKIKKELDVLKAKKTGPKNKEILKFMDLNCECVIFCKTRKPIVPETFVRRIMQEFADPKVNFKRTRYVQKLTPVTFSRNASIAELSKLSQQVLKDHFHEAGTPPLKFAVEVTRRNFNTIEKLDIIKEVAKQVGKDGQLEHKVDLKNYDKLVLVECFKNNIGMSVVDSDYREQYKKYNIQQIFEAKLKKEILDKQSLEANK